MDKQEAIKILKEFHDTSALFSVRTALETVFPELKEDENELEWLKQFIQEEAYILSMDIRDDEDSFRLKKLQRSLEWLEKQGGTSKEWTISDAATLKEIIDFLENGTAKLQHDLTRYANWLKIQFTPIEKQGEQKSIGWKDSKELKKIRKPLYGRGDIIEYRGCPYFIEEVVTPKENIFYYNVVSLCFGEKSRKSIGAEGEKDIILISNNRFDYEQADIQQKDFVPKASFANRQVYNRAILTILSNYVEKYPDIRFGQMLCNLDVNPHFDEESKETYWNLSKTIDKQKS